MKPVEMSDDERSFLPKHKALVLAKDQPQYQPLPVVLVDGQEGRMVTKWELTEDERTMIAAGAELYLEQLTFGHPFQPVLLTVGPRYGSAICEECDGTGSVLDAPANVLDGRSYRKECPICDGTGKVLS